MIENLPSPVVSIGNPTNKMDLEFNVQAQFQYKGESKILNHKETGELIFSEIGNQSYGFTLGKEVRNELEKISTVLKTKHKNKFKVLVVHHPPNWLNWNELYKFTNVSRGPFHGFIVENDIDVMLAGHEHTSGVPADLLFGKTLLLKAGMFLDHHEEVYEQSWFKILELDEHGGLREIPYHYHKTRNKWVKKDEYIYHYRAWKNICSKGENQHQKEESDQTSMSQSNKKRIEAKDLETYVKRCTKRNTSKVKEEFFELLDFQGKIFEKEDEKGTYVCEHNDKYIVLIPCIEDYFKITEGNQPEIPKESYLCTVTEGNDFEDKDVHIIYLYSLNKRRRDFNSDDISKIKNLVRKKSDQFRFYVYRDKSLLSKLKNAKFAVRLVL